MRLDEIGYWSEIKLEIVRSYAAEYAKILARRPRFQPIYVDAFSGAGEHLSKTTGEVVPGSPQRVLAITPKFVEYHFIDLNRRKTDHLAELIGPRDDVFIYNEDCNDVLLSKVFPRARYEDYRRALCLLDPYGLHLKWDVIRTAAAMTSIEIFLNFPVMDMNMNVLHTKNDHAKDDQIARMTAFWGDESWREAAYSTDLAQPNLFDEPEKTTNDALADAFRTRLIKIAGFPYVPQPIPMRNSKNAIVYYLFFASHNQVGGKIASHILNKYRNWTM